MADSPAQFVWYELVTTDAAAAEAFYRKVVGWEAVKAGGPHDYTLLQVAGVGVAGLMTLPAEALAGGARPAWMGYIGVDDVDAHVGKVIAAGGAEHRAPETIPGVGRFALVSDPQGALFVLFTPPSGMTRPAVDPTAPGIVGWHELMAVDGPAAFEFYSDLFGWKKTTPYNMGPMGIYQLFSAGGDDIGGMMTKPPSVPHPFWNYYIRVDSVTAAVGRIAAAGGSVANGPMEVPGGDWIVQGFDPQNAFFCLMSSGR